MVLGKAVVILLGMTAPRGLIDGGAEGLKISEQCILEVLREYTEHIATTRMQLVSCLIVTVGEFLSFMMD